MPVCKWAARPGSLPRLNLVDDRAAPERRSIQSLERGLLAGFSVWSGPTRMTKQWWGTTGTIYVLHGDTLWEVDTETGDRTVFGTENAWPEFTTIFCRGETSSRASIHIIQDIHDRLLRVSADGEWHETDGLPLLGGPTLFAGKDCSSW
jgi:hypothetical protein